MQICTSIQGYESCVTGFIDVSFFPLLGNYIFVIFYRWLLDPEMCYKNSWYGDITKLIVILAHRSYSYKYSMDKEDYKL